MDNETPEKEEAASNQENSKCPFEEKFFPFSRKKVEVVRKQNTWHKYADKRGHRYRISSVEWNEDAGKSQSCKGDDPDLFFLFPAAPCKDISCQFKDGKGGKKPQGKIPEGESPESRKQEKKVFPFPFFLYNRVVKKEKGGNKGHGKISPDEILPCAAGNGGDGKGMKKPPAESPGAFAAQGKEQEKDKAAGKADPEPELDGEEICQIRIVLISKRSGGGFIFRKDIVFEFVAVTEEMFQPHNHLAVGGDMFQTSYGGVFFRDGFTCGNILGIRVHHGTLNGVGHEVGICVRKELPEKSELDLFAAAEDFCNAFRFSVVVVCPHGKSGKDAEKKENKGKKIRVSGKEFFHYE
jgi:hypothetical protein